MDDVVADRDARLGELRAQHDGMLAEVWEDVCVCESTGAVF